MHPSVLDFTQRVLTLSNVRGRSVLEVGSCDVNGSVRPYIESLQPRRYIGVDAAAGPRVDRVVNCEHLTSQISGHWHIVISTEMLEHVTDWKTCLEQLTEIVAPQGLLLITTRSPGFPYHPFPQDNWRFTIDDMTAIMAALRFTPLNIEDDTQCPGVFVLARKPRHWTTAKYRPSWRALSVGGVTV